MTKYRQLNDKEIAGLMARGCSAADWTVVRVCDGGSVENISACRFAGRVDIGRGVEIHGVGRMSNCRIGDGAVVESTDEIVCRSRSLFGGGTMVAAVNENGGRAVPLCVGLTAQVAYMAAMYRHRPGLVAALCSMITGRAEAAADDMCTIGRGARIVGCGALRECRVGDGALLDGVDILQNVTVESCTDSASFVGRGAKCYDTLISRGAHVGDGVQLERCFVGEGVKADRGFSAVDVLMFACCHFENGEAVSLFAGPFTVSHHKSTLLIAGCCSFFNAGSGSGQSNHLLKTGPVHEALHRRGVKLASNAYVMAPAAEGIFTLVMGRHESHHDTTDFPYSYLIEEEGRSYLMPGHGLRSAGTARDIEKWPARDHRRNGRDLIRFDRFNPFEGEAVRRALGQTERLLERASDVYNFRGVRIKSLFLRRGRSLYEQALKATLGALSELPAEASAEGAGPWVDMAGMLAPRGVVERLMDSIEAGKAENLESVEAALADIHAAYGSYARGWALDVLAATLGHEPQAEDVARAVAEGAEAAVALRRLAEADAASDAAASMAVGYGADAIGDEERMADFRAVRGLLPDDSGGKL